MGVSVSASRGAGDRAGTIARMCLALMFSLATLAVPASAASAKAKALIFMMPRSNPRLRDDQIYARSDVRGRTRVCSSP